MLKIQLKTPRWGGVFIMGGTFDSVLPQDVQQVLDLTELLNEIAKQTSLEL